MKSANTNEQTNQDKILARLQKLIALNERPGSIGEAATSTALINHLLTKYNLSRTDVNNYKPKESIDNIIYLRGKYADYQSEYDGGFVKSLMESMSAFNFCKMINVKAFDEKGHNKNFGFTVLGKKHNLDVCMYMFDYCLNNIKILFDQYFVEKGIGDYFKKGSGKYYVHRRGFYEGAIIAIHNRLAAQRDKEVEEHEPKPQNHNNFEDDDYDVNNSDIPENPDETTNESDESEESPHENELPPSSTENSLIVLLKENQKELDEAAERLAKEEFDGELKKGRNQRGTSDAEAKYFGHKAGSEMSLLQGLNGDAEMAADIKQLRGETKRLN